MDSRWFPLSNASHCFSRAARVFHLQLPTQLTTGLSKPELQRPSVLKYTRGSGGGPRVHQGRTPAQAPALSSICSGSWGLLKTFMDNKTIYSLPCGRLFKPSTRGSRTFLALPAKMSAEGGDGSGLNTAPESSQFSLHSKRQISRRKEEVPCYRAAADVELQVWPRPCRRAGEGRGVTCFGIKQIFACEASQPRVGSHRLFKALARLGAGLVSLLCDMGVTRGQGNRDESHTFAV